MDQLLTNLGIGFGVALSINNLLYCLGGVILGTLIGVLPGIGPVATVPMGTSVAAVSGWEPASAPFCWRMKATTPRY